MPHDRLLTATLALAMAQGVQAQTHVYVDDDAPAGGTGLSWQSALNDLHDAIELAKSLGQNRGEIRIAGGFYDAGSQPFEVPLATPDLAPMRLLGGFAGLSNMFNPNARDTDLYSTILDADDFENIIVLTSAVVLSPGATARPAFASSTSATTLDGLSFRNTFAAALFNTDRLLTVRINDCEFVGLHSNIHGAAIFSDLDLYIERSLFALNTSLASNAGGALRITGGTSSISGCAFLANAANSVPGGAVSIVDGHHAIAGCSFFDNSAGGSGGALFIDASSALITDCEFFDNASPVSGGGGGAHVRVTGTGIHTTINRCIFIGNSAADGGSLLISNQTGSEDSAVEILQSTFLQSVATGSGGAVLIPTNSGPIRISEGDFAGNRASDGGAIFGPANVEDSLFEDNTASANGGAFHGNGVGTAYNSEFVDNLANFGGGCYSVSAITLSGFSGNRAFEYGGGAYGANSFTSVTAMNNRARQGAGGTNIQNVSYSTIANNNGGGLNGVALSIHQSSILDNTNGHGLALTTLNNLATGSQATVITSSRIEGNEEGGILATNRNASSTIEISDSTIAGNGSFGFDVSPTTGNTVFGISINRSRIVGNAGNAVRVSPRPFSVGNALTILDSLLETSDFPVLAVGGDTQVALAGITATGSGHFNTLQINSPAELLLESSIVMRNDNTRAIDLIGSDAIVVQTLVEGGAGAIALTAPATIQIIGSLVNVDPRFVDADGPDNDPMTWQDNDFSLAPGSEAIDNGAMLAIISGRDEDLAGDPRNVNDPGMPDDGFGFGSVIDLGAYEFQGETCAPDVNNDGAITPADFGAWISAFNANSRRADQNFDHAVTPADFSAWILAFHLGCP